MIVALISLLAGQNALVFKYRDGDYLVDLSIANGHVNSHRVKRSVDTSVGAIVSTSAYSAKVRFEEHPQKVDFLFNSGQTQSIGRTVDPANGGGTISGDQRGRFFVDVSISASHAYSTKVYRVLDPKVEYICTVPGRALDVIDDRIVSAVKKDDIQFFSLSNPPRGDENFPAGKQIRLVYGRRAALSKRDQYRETQPDGLPLNQGQQPSWLGIAPQGKYWFEAGYRTYVREGKHDNTEYFGGDVILSSQGVEWQWKYHNIGLRGAYFVDSHTFRFFRSEKFLMGNTSLKSFEPGIYDLDLTTKNVKRVDSKPLSLKTLLNNSYRLFP